MLSANCAASRAAAGVPAAGRSRAHAVRVQAAFGLNLPKFAFPTFGKAASSGASAAQKREEAKAQLLSALEGLNRGAAADDEQKAQVEALASALEKLNPNAKSTLVPALTGKWRLLYTTSASILGLSRPPFLRPSGPIYQTIDVEKLRARNNESAPFFNAVTAALTPTGPQSVDVQFDTFYIFNLIPIKAPPAAKGSLRVTYLDDDLRVARGDKGNLFVLDMADADARL